MGKSLILGLVFWLALLSPVSAQPTDPRTFLPAGSHQYAPVLVRVQASLWPEAPEPHTLAGQVEQESCISLRHSKCWNPRAELKTSREYGFGFGQITVAYNANGSVRFNKFEELRTSTPALKNWRWEDRYDPSYQLAAMVHMDRLLYLGLTDVPSVRERWAMTLAAYNGGKGGLLQDRIMCTKIRGCDSRVWFDNVELTSVKSRVVHPGYGKSAFEINREYPRLVLNLRRDKYRVFWKE